MIRAAALLLPPLLALAGGALETPKARESTQASETTLPIFTDEGFRSMYIRGSAVEIADTGQRAQMKDMHLTAYVGDAAGTVQGILIAPEATLIGKDHVEGDKSVRILRDDLDATAMKWSYDKKEQLITLIGNVKVTFKAELREILK